MSHRVTAAQHSLLRRSEVWIVWLLGAASLALIPILRGEISLSWDALNHHIYLGWIAAEPRFHRDFLAAGWQSYQYPYLYWPAYKLAVAGASGVTAGVVLAMLQSLAVPAIWLVARCLCPGDRPHDVVMRFLAVALALSGGVTLSLADTTSNDFLAGVPLLWSIALALLANGQVGLDHRRRMLILLSGFCAGISLAAKLSNGPLVLVLPLVWASIEGGVPSRVMRVTLAGAAAMLGFVLCYAPWGWAMWEQFGNPVYPFYDAAFDTVRALMGWKRP